MIIDIIGADGGAMWGKPSDVRLAARRGNVVGQAHQILA